MQVNIVTHTLNTGYYQSALINPKPTTNKPTTLPVLPKWAQWIMSQTWFNQSKNQGNPIYFIEKLYPYFLMDHIPSQYFEGLQRARIYYEQEELEHATESLYVP